MSLVHCQLIISSFLLSMFKVDAKVLKGSTAELPASKYRSLDRKQGSRQGSSCSQQSTPVRSLARSPLNSTSSLPRSPKGKMPLFGKVAGYRQPPSCSPVPPVAPASRPCRLSEPGAEIWVDSKPNCDRDLVQPGSAAQQQYDANAIYGYMDEQKKAMIQQWVEGQAVTHRAPPDHLTGIESLAWLQAQSEQRDYQALTQFKLAESSPSSVCSSPAGERSCPGPATTEARVEVEPVPSSEVRQVADQPSLAVETRSVASSGSSKLCSTVATNTETPGRQDPRTQDPYRAPRKAVGSHIRPNLTWSHLARAFRIIFLYWPLMLLYRSQGFPAKRLRRSGI